jgi:hypothetical protein
MTGPRRVFSHPRSSSHATLYQPLVAVLRHLAGRTGLIELNLSLLLRGRDTLKAAAAAPASSAARGGGEIGAGACFPHLRKLSMLVHTVGALRHVVALLASDADEAAPPLLVAP